MNAKGFASFRITRGIFESESERNRKIRIPKGIRPSKMFDILHKVSRPTEITGLRLQFRYQGHTYRPSFVLYRQPLWFLKATFGHQAKVTQKVRKSASNIKMYFEQFFIFLQKISTFITFLLKKVFCYRYVAYLQRNTHAELLDGCFPVNCLNIRRTPFLKNTSG